MGNSTRELVSQSNSYHASSEYSLFSTSLPVLSHEKLNMNKLGPELKGKKLLEDDDNLATESCLLPDDEEYFSGMVNGIVDDSEDYEIFGGGGGLEMESDQESLRVAVANLSLSDGGVSNGGARLNPASNGVGPVVGEHPLGEHPSRTLFVRNINSNVEDAEIISLFEQYGDIRTLYSACKSRGFVIISYYDIRDARNAMRALQSKPLRKRKLDIHFSIPKENPSDKDINQGTLVVFNLDPSVTNEELQQIFGVYGEVKEIRETPHKRHHKFIEFYDVRDSEAALKSLNRSDIAGKRIKLEPSRPGGARKSLLLQPNYELEQDGRNMNQGASFIGNSPPGPWPQLGSPMERNHLKNFSNSPVFSSVSPPLGSTSVPELTSLSQPHVSSQRVGSTGIDIPSAHSVEHIFANGNSNRLGLFEQPHTFPEEHVFANRNSNRLGLFEQPHTFPEEHIFANRNSNRLGLFEQPHTFPEEHIFANGNSNRLGLFEQPHTFPEEHMFANGNSNRLGLFEQPHTFPEEHIFANGNSNCLGLFEQPHTFPEQKLSQFSGPISSFGTSTFNRSTSKPLPGAHLVWENNGYPFANIHHYHAGSAPSGVPLEHQFGYFQESPKAPFVGPSYEGVGASVSYTDRSYMGSVGPCVAANGGAVVLRNSLENGSSAFNVPSLRPSPLYLGNRQFHGRATASNSEGLAERRSRRFDVKGIQLDDKKQFQLDLNKIRSGEETRTTLMIKNIPNKYTSKMLLVAIEEQHRGTFDFLYLPIDFKNKCNVGYAFINMLSPSDILPFYETFNGKKWEKFNSEKVASLAFARIQGKDALVAHFQNSSLMMEDKRCRPMVFDSARRELKDKDIQEKLPAYGSTSQPRQSNGFDYVGSTRSMPQNIPGNRVDKR